MAWIRAEYHTNNDNTADTMINLNNVRRIGKTDNGWARIFWTTRVDSIILAETYERFTTRVLTRTEGNDVLIRRAAVNPPSPPTNQGDNTNG